MFLYKQQYYDKIGDPVKDKEKFESALATALDIRKFEIELYWKRSQYFWAFTSISLGAYGYTWKLAQDNPQFSWIPLCVSVILLLLSVNWYLVVSGSKFWQNNWERHVDLLEDVVHGPIYKTIILEKPKKEGLLILSASPYSVSKINQAMCAFFYSIAVLLFFRESAFLIYNLVKNTKFNRLYNLIVSWDCLENFTVIIDIVTASIVVILVLYFLFILHYQCLSNLGNFRTKKTKMEKGTIKIYERDIKFRE